MPEKKPETGGPDNLTARFKADSSVSKAARPNTAPDVSPSIPGKPRAQGDSSATFGLLGTASTMGLHMVSGPIVGGFLGWLIDRWLGSGPVGAGVGVLLGVAAGFRNVWADARHLIKSQEEIDKKKDAPE